MRDELAGHASVAVCPEHLLAAVVAVGGQQGGGLLKPGNKGQWNMGPDPAVVLLVTHFEAHIVHESIWRACLLRWHPVEQHLQ